MYFKRINYFTKKCSRMPVKQQKMVLVIQIYNLVICYVNGKGTEINLEKAFHWFQKATENGDKEAMYNSATYYKNGEETEVNL
jgi:TPR repeat protein